LITVRKLLFTVYWFL